MLSTRQQRCCQIVRTSLNRKNAGRYRRFPNFFEAYRKILAQPLQRSRCAVVTAKRPLGMPHDEGPSPHLPGPPKGWIV